MTYYMMMKLALGFSKTKLRKPYTTTIGSSVVKLLVLHSFKAKPLSFRESSSSWATTSRIPRQSTQAILNSRFSLLSSIVHYEKSWCMCKIISTYINLSWLCIIILYLFVNIIWGDPIKHAKLFTVLHSVWKWLENVAFWTVSFKIFFCQQQHQVIFSVYLLTE